MDEPTAPAFEPILRADGTILLSPYDPRWPRIADRVIARVRAALGPAALRIEHVGSTSVPGLAAKPVIDIDLVVADPTEEDDYLPALEAAGFRFHLREPDWFAHRLFRGEGPAVNLHVFPQGCAEVERMLAFRDHLRADATDRRLYEDTKRRLAARSWGKVQDYADAKSAVVAEIMQRALNRLADG